MKVLKMNGINTSKINNYTHKAFGVNNPISVLEPSDVDTEWELQYASHDDNSQSTTSPYTAYTSTTLYKAMRPFFINLKLFGLYHSREYNWPFTTTEQCHDSHMGNTHTNKWHFSPSQIYSLVIIVISVCNVGRSLCMFTGNDPFGPVLFGKMLVFAWYLLCMMSLITTFRACHVFTALPEFFIEWEKLHENDKEVYCLGFCRKRAVFLSIACWVIVVVNTAVVLYLFIQTYLMDDIISPFSKQSHRYEIVFGLYCLWQVYLSAHWGFPIALHYILCVIICQEFKRFNASLKSAIKFQNNLSTGGLPSKFEELRKRHQAICKLVRHADDVLSLYNGVAGMQSLLAGCVAFYNVIWYEDVRNDPLSLAAFLFWASCTMFLLGSVCIGGAMVNNQAHAATEYIYDINTSNLSTDQSAQLFMFVSRLTGERIGLTAMKLFIFDNQAILTILSVLITYFVVMLQFSPVFVSSSTTETTSSYCNCTELLYNSTLQCVTV